MTTYVGLYYPFIHFKDDGWLKLAALYWDKMGRIVPQGYDTHDSITVRQLTEELGFVVNYEPAYEVATVGKKFVRVLAKHEEALRSKYGVNKSHSWPDNAYTLMSAHQSADPKFAYVYVGKKMWEPLGIALEASGLALRNRVDKSRWIGMHPQLANIYLAALAEEIAETNGIHPVTDETINHVAVAGY